MTIGKRLKEAKAKVNPTKAYSIDEALTLVKETSKVKFDASVEVHINLGIDIKITDQIVRGTVILPHGTGKKVRVAAFVPEDKVKEAKDAGADIVGNTELIEQIKKDGKCDFDVAVATPDMMKNLAVVARTLGQKGLMPNPKTGTITVKVGQTVKELKQGKVAYKNDNYGNLHVVIGKVSFDDQKLKENFTTFVDSVKQAKPEKIKGVFLKGIYLSSSMGPSVKITL